MRSTNLQAPALRQPDPRCIEEQDGRPTCTQLRQAQPRHICSPMFPCRRRGSIGCNPHPPWPLLPLLFSCRDAHVEPASMSQPQLQADVSPSPCPHSTNKPCASRKDSLWANSDTPCRLQKII